MPTVSSPYLVQVDDGMVLTLWLGRGVRPEFMQGVFGWGHGLDSVDPASLRVLPPQTSAEAQHVNSIIETARAQRSWGWMPVRCTCIVWLVVHPLQCEAYPCAEI